MQSVILSEMHLPIREPQLVEIMDAALADAARRAGDWLVCRAGCTQCCVGAFSINSLDALRLRAGLAELRLHQPALAAEVTERARLWLYEFGSTFPGSSTTGLLGTSEDEVRHFEDFANDAPCPALNPSNGHCDLYRARPMTCRVFGPPVPIEIEQINAESTDGDSTIPVSATATARALGHCELCFAGATPEQVAACEMQLPDALEASLVEELAAQGLSGETVVAFALID